MRMVDNGSGTDSKMSLHRKKHGEGFVRRLEGLALIVGWMKEGCVW
jgi:hypothetical protein